LLQTAFGAAVYFPTKLPITQLARGRESISRELQRQKVFVTVEGRYRVDSGIGRWYQSARQDSVVIQI
jgi:hypothetical protein